MLSTVLRGGKEVTGGVEISLHGGGDKGKRGGERSHHQTQYDIKDEAVEANQLKQSAGKR